MRRTKTRTHLSWVFVPYGDISSGTLEEDEKIRPKCGGTLWMKNISGRSLSSRVSSMRSWEPERDAAKDNRAHGFSDIEENSIPS